MLQDMGPSLEYLSPYGKQIFDAAGDVPFMQGTVNNKLYGIPFIGDGKEDSQFIFLRTDWLANLGLAPPKTMDDMINIIKAFTDKDPDGNGVKDTYGLGIKDELFSWGIILTGFFNSYHSYPRIWIEKDGKLEFGGVQPEAKNALAKLSELFKGGYIDPEFAVKPNDKLGEDVNTGKIGAFYSQHWYGLALGDSKKNNPKTDWLPYPLVSADSGKVLNGVVNPTGSWWVANKKAKNPEAMIKILNKYYETQYDEKIQRFNTTGLVETPDGVAEAWTLCPVITYKSDLNGVYYQRLIDPLKTGDDSSLWGEAKTVYGYIDKWRKTGDMSVYGWQMVYDDKSTWSIIMDDYVPNEKLIYNKFFGPTTATMVTKQGALDTMQTEVYTKIIMGQSPVDSFDQFVKDWYALGGEAITKEVNDWKSSLK
jgi:putative aldouronate transport system substrate-binding protein